MPEFRWWPVTPAKPGDNVIIWTRHQSPIGIGREVKLERRGGKWFIPGSDAQVMPEPTHWRPVAKDE